jgi:TorA maturation chaperone TorD
VIPSLAQADLVLLAARLMSAPGQIDPVVLDITDDQIGDLAEAAGTCRGSALAAAVRAVLREARCSDPAMWQGEHTRLFEAAVVCPINETAYVRRDKGVILADICGFYNAFGFEPDETSGEKADHLICELEFAGVLLVMLGEAERVHDPEKIAVVRSALQDFLREHLGEWLGMFCERLSNTAATPLHRRCAEVLHELWDLLAKGLDLEVFDHLVDEVDPEAWEDAGSPYECDMAEEEQFVPLTGPSESGLPRADS